MKRVIIFLFLLSSVSLLAQDLGRTSGYRSKGKVRATELEVEGDATIDGKLVVDDSMRVNGTSLFKGDATFQADILMTGIVSETLEVIGTAPTILMVDNDDASPDTLAVTMVDSIAQFDGATFVIDTENDYVGIGTFTPDAKLEVADQIHLNGTTDAFLDVDRSASGNAGRIRFQTDGSDNFEIGEVGGVVGFHITDGSANPLITVLSNGPVGIGTVLPGVDLEIANNTANAAHSFLILLNDDEQASGETGQTSDIVFEMKGTSDGGSNFTNQEAAKISNYKISDYYHASNETDNDAGLKIYTVTDGSYILNSTFSDDDLRVEGTSTLIGQLVVGGVTQDGRKQNQFGGDFISDGSATTAFKQYFSGSLTGYSGDIAYIIGTSLTNTITTQTATENVNYIAQLFIAEPNITNNLTGNINVASSIYIQGAPDEGVTNAAIYVTSGDLILANGNVTATNLYGDSLNFDTSKLVFSPVQDSLYVVDLKVDGTATLDAVTSTTLILTLNAVALTDGAPTDTEIDTGTGTTPGAVASGWTTYLEDNSDGVIYQVVSDGVDSWYYFTGTLAVNP